MRKSLGFTLAEVLITLAIIGVVAAMTIPSVIVNTNQQEFKTGLKKAVSVLNQAITMNVALENVTPADLRTASTKVNIEDSLMGYLAKRLNVIKETEKLTFGSQNAAFYTADGMRFEFPATPTFTGVTGLRGTACESATPCLVMVDVNGDKKPNPQTNGQNATYLVPADVDSDRITDVFSIMINENSAIPMGVVAQRTMFQN